jgi:hypothetical protein
MFGPGFDPSSVTVPSACYFGSMRVDGEFDAMKSQLTCLAPSLKQITKTSSSANVELRISLDGQIFSDETVMVRYGSGKSSLSTITAPKQFNNWFDIMQFDYLPFHPEYCVFFENGDFASLAGIAVTPGVIEPPFYSGTFEYFVLLTVDDLPDMRVALTPVATQPDATIRIGGLYGKQVRSGDTFRIGVRLGENKALIVVTSPNGLSTRTYIVTVYVLMDEEEGASLGDIQLDRGELEPSFMPDVFKYSTFLDSTNHRIGITPHSLSGNDVKICRITTGSSEEMKRMWARKRIRKNFYDNAFACETVNSGEKGYMRLEDGFNLIQIRAKDGRNTAVYELLAYKEPGFDDGFSCDGFAEAGLVDTITHSLNVDIDYSLFSDPTTQFYSNFLADLIDVLTCNAQLYLGDASVTSASFTINSVTADRSGYTDISVTFSAPIGALTSSYRSQARENLQVFFSNCASVSVMNLQAYDWSTNSISISCEEGTVIIPLDPYNAFALPDIQVKEGSRGIITVPSSQEIEIEFVDQSYA